MNILKRQLVSTFFLATSLTVFPQALDFTALKATKSPGSELDEIDEKYVTLGDYPVKDGMLVFDSPAGSVTTFYAK